MPKVKEGYFEKKKNFILDAVENICKNKPIYKLTMKDIIKETKLSTGAIYSSFSDIDDVIVELQKRFDVAGEFNMKIQNISKENIEPDKKLEKLLKEAITFIQSIMELPGKINFELKVLILADKERGIKLSQKLLGVGTAMYIPMVFDLIEENTISGFFKPKVSKECIYAFIMIFLDGLVRDITLEKSYNIELPENITFEEKELSEVFSKSVLELLM